jgi:predicted ester cyclase
MSHASHEQTLQERNKALVKRFVEHGFAASGQDPAQAKDYLHPDVVYHTPHAEGHSAQGHTRMADASRNITAHLPDMRVKADVLLAEGDYVTAHWVMQGTHRGRGRLVHAAEVVGTGQEATFSGVGIYRVRDGKIAELWNYDDHLYVLQQTGALGGQRQS